MPRTSKHNRGRKPEYKEHRANEVFNGKRNLDESPNLDISEENQETSFTILGPVTFGEVISNKVALKADTEISLPSERLGAPIHKSSVYKGKNAGRAMLRSFNFEKPKVIRKNFETTIQKIRKLKDHNAKEFFLYLASEYKRSKSDLFKKIFRMDSTVEYALPLACHEMEPSEFLEMLEAIDFTKLALAMGYTELEIRKYSRIH